MALIRLNSIPKVTMAHVFKSEEYRNLLAARENRIEISYFETDGGCIGLCGGKHKIEAGAVAVNLYRHPVSIDVDTPHCHHTVAFSVSFSDGGEAREAVCLPEYFIPQNGARIYAAIDELIRVHTLHPDEPLRASGLTLELISLIDKESRSEGAPRVTGEYRYVRRAKQYIFDHVNSPIRAREVAEHLGITPEYLSSVFKSCEGKTLISYINGIKLEGIRALVEQGNLTMAEAALSYGYADPNYVSRLFKRTYGISLTDCILGRNLRKYK